MKKTVKNPPDHAQRRRIAEDLGTCLLVEAAAGTGKTTSLVGRMIALIREGICDIEHLAAVTFTRKAAAELRARFQLELERTAQVADGAGQARLADALAKLNRCYVGTIHSFCAKLLRERPIEAGVDLAFRELEEAEDELLRASAWSEFVAGLFTEDDVTLDELSDLGLKIAQLRPTFLAFAEYPDVDAWPTGEVELGDLSGAVRELKSYLAHMATLADTFPPDRGTDTLMTAYERLVRLARHRNLDRPADLLELLEACKPNQKTTQKYWPGGAKQGKAESERWVAFATGVAQPLVERWRQKRYALVIRVMQRAVAAYDRVRVLCTQQRCSWVVGNTSASAFQKPSAPSPIASFGAIVRLRRFAPKSSSLQDWALSRCPSFKAISSFLPSFVAPISTRMHCRSSSKRMFV